MKKQYTVKDWIDDDPKSYAICCLAVSGFPDCLIKEPDEEAVMARINERYENTKGKTPNKSYFDRERGGDK